VSPCGPSRRWLRAMPAVWRCFPGTVSNRRRAARGYRRSPRGPSRRGTRRASIQGRTGCVSSGRRCDTRAMRFLGVSPETRSSRRTSREHSVDPRAPTAPRDRIHLARHPQHPLLPRGTLRLRLPHPAARPRTPPHRGDTHARELHHPPRSKIHEPVCSKLVTALAKAFGISNVALWLIYGIGTTSWPIIIGRAITLTRARGRADPEVETHVTAVELVPGARDFAATSAGRRA
jgi:hypothetical protein